MEAWRGEDAEVGPNEAACCCAGAERGARIAQSPCNRPTMNHTHPLSSRIHGTVHGTPDPSVHLPSPTDNPRGRRLHRVGRTLVPHRHKARSSPRTRGRVRGVTDPQTKRQRHVGLYASEEDASRAYDCAAMQARRPGAERNFPGETITELPETVCEERKQRSSSRYVGVSWDKRGSS
jgi:hypothetical protein